MKWLTSLVAVLVLAGCATPIPFNSVSLGGEPTVISARGANLIHVAGAVRGADSGSFVPIGALLVPVSTGPFPKLQFHAQDQSEFMEVLRSELLRLKVFKDVSVQAPGVESDFRITVVFAQTFHQIHSSHEYTLDVVMNIEGGRSPFLKQYRVNSNEKSTAVERWTTNAYEGKVLAVQRLLERLVPDIQAYVAQNA